MRYAVTKEFSTPRRRFVVGAELDAAEIDAVPTGPRGYEVPQQDGPLTAAGWADRGFLRALPEEKAEPAPAAEPAAATIDIPPRARRGAPSGE